jgi:hypothetical protein
VARETTFGLGEVEKVALEVVREPVTISVAHERVRVHNLVANKEMSALISADCNVTVDCNEVDCNEEGDRRSGPGGLPLRAGNAGFRVVD